MITSFVKRSILQRCAAFLILGFVPAVGLTQASEPSAADGYAPNFDGHVYALATQPDGKVVVGGQFGNFRDRAGFTHRRRNVARLNTDGSLDQTFDPDPSAPVRAIVIEPDARIIIGGDFTTLQPNGVASAITRNRIARINADGTVDAGFDPNLSAPLQPQVYAIVRQCDGRIVVGGSFTSARPNGSSVASTRNYLARFNSDGSLDVNYEPHPNGFVLSLALHVDDKLLVGGGFTSFWESGSPEPSNRFRLARLNPNGTLDSEFNMEVNNAVNALAVQFGADEVTGSQFVDLFLRDRGIEAPVEVIKRLQGAEVGFERISHGLHLFLHRPILDDLARRSRCPRDANYRFLGAQHSQGPRVRSEYARVPPVPLQRRSPSSVGQQPN